MLQDEPGSDSTWPNHPLATGCLKRLVIVVVAVAVVVPIKDSRVLRSSVSRDPIAAERECSYVDGT